MHSYIAYIASYIFNSILDKNLCVIQQFNECFDLLRKHNEISFDDIFSTLVLLFSIEFLSKIVGVVNDIYRILFKEYGCHLGVPRNFTLS